MLQTEGVISNNSNIASKGSKENVVNIGHIAEWVVVQQGEPGVFPCIATHPDVTISLFRLWRYDINGRVEMTLDEVRKNSFFYVPNIAYNLYKFNNRGKKICYPEAIQVGTLTVLLEKE